MVIHTIILWGWRDPFLTYHRRTIIAKAVCKQVAYDFGYQKPLAHTQLPYWYGKLNNAIAAGESNDPVSPSYCGSKKYTYIIEKQHPGYLHELYRYEESIKGNLATFQELSDVINSKSTAPGEQQATLSISWRQLAAWFRYQGGKEISAVEKPLLTNKHKQKRVELACTYFDILQDTNCPVAFLDKKGFYTTSRQKNLKVLSKGKDETKIPQYRRPKIRSR